MVQKDRTYSIYRHTSPSGKVYIGQTCSKVWVRWLHNGNGYKNQSYFWRAIQKYGWNNFTHEVLLEGISKKEADYAEKYLIKWYKTHKMSYNCTDGGEGVRGIIPWNKGKKTGIIPWNKGLPMSDEIKEKVSKSKKGHKYGPQSVLHSLHKAEARKVPIIQVDINNPCIWKKWKSAKDAQDALGFNRKNIGRSITNVGIHAYGYFWFYLDDFSPNNYEKKQKAYEKAKIHYAHPKCPDWINKDGVNTIQCLKKKF